MGIFNKWFGGREGRPSPEDEKMDNPVASEAEEGAPEAEEGEMAEVSPEEKEEEPKE